MTTRAAATSGDAAGSETLGLPARHASVPRIAFVARTSLHIGSNALFGSDSEMNSIF